MRASDGSATSMMWLLIVDEIATGFGKTGAMFACELEGVVPDMTVLGKGITGGYLPLSATVTSERIYEAFYDASDESKKLFHGHTYAGNPICCAAALANLDVFESEDVLGRVRERAAFLSTQLAERLGDHPRVGEIPPARADGGHRARPPTVRVSSRCPASRCPGGACASPRATTAYSCVRWATWWS